LTKHLEHKDHIILADAMFKKHFVDGHDIIRFGDLGYEYFILANGKVKVTVYTPGSNPFDPKLSEKIQFVKELSSEPEMIGFGEIALLLNDKRTATVTADTKEGCDTWVLGVDVFKNIIASTTLRKRSFNL
jgi:cAMP-dependent protein kinase regulator